MALMIPDAAGIYTEAAPPLAYDPALEAYRDTEGLAYDHTLEAWKKVWPEGPEKRYLYRDGNECTDVTGGWKIHYGAGFNGSGYGTLAKNTDNMHLWVADANYYVSVIPSMTVDMTGYNRITIGGSFEFKDCYDHTGSKFGMLAFDSFQAATSHTYDGYELPTVSADGNAGVEPGLSDINLKNKELARISFDVSHLAGHKYLYLLGYCGVLDFTFRKIWLE